MIDKPNHLHVVPDLSPENGASQGAPADVPKPELFTGVPGMDPIAPDDSQEPSREVVVTSSPGDEGHAEKVGAWEDKVAQNQAVAASAGVAPPAPEPLFGADTAERKAAAQRHPSNPRPRSADEEMNQAIEEAAVRVVDGKSPNQVATDQQINLAAAERQNREDAGLPPPTANLT